MNPVSFTVGLLLVLEALSAFVAAFLVYVAFLVIREEQKNGVPRDLRETARRGIIFFIVVAVSLALTHVAALLAGIIVAALVLFAALGACAFVYFKFVRESWKDDRIQYAVLLWSAAWILIGLLLLFVSWAIADGVAFSPSPIDAPSFAQYVATFAQIASIIIAAAMVVVTNRHNAREADETARQQIYQTLELESINLFRFECDHAELVQMLWFEDETAKAALERINRGGSADLDLARIPMEMRVKLYQLKQYTCQTLNLFEMACKFLKQDIIAPDVFGSWVIWMWELCCEPMFQLQWKGTKGIEFNYIGELRDIMNAGVHFSTQRAGEYEDTERMRSFYDFVAALMFPEKDQEHHRKLVKGWLDSDSKPALKYDDFWHRSGENQKEPGTVN